MLGSAIHATSEATKRQFSGSPTTDNTTHHNHITSQRLADQETYDYSLVHGGGDDSTSIERQSRHRVSQARLESRNNLIRLLFHILHLLPNPNKRNHLFPHLLPNPNMRNHFKCT